MTRVDVPTLELAIAKIEAQSFSDPFDGSRIVLLSDALAALESLRPAAESQPPCNCGGSRLANVAHSPEGCYFVPPVSVESSSTVGQKENAMSDSCGQIGDDAYFNRKTCIDCQATWSGVNTPNSCPNCHSRNVYQEQDSPSQPSVAGDSAPARWTAAEVRGKADQLERHWLIGAPVDMLRAYADLLDAAPSRPMTAEDR